MQKKYHWLGSAYANRCMHVMSSCQINCEDFEKYFEQYNWIA